MDTSDKKTDAEIQQWEKSLPQGASKYQEIAYDIAVKIALGKYKPGEKLYVKSSISCQYGVSYETARRALAVLSNLEIVKTVKGSGVTIYSCEKASEYVAQFKDVTTVSELQNQLQEELRLQNESARRMDGILQSIKEKVSRMNMAKLFSPYAISLSDDCPHLGKTLRDLNFWHNTLATVLAIRRGEQMLLSPGPYEIMMAGDVLYYVGDWDSVSRVEMLMCPKSR